MKIVFLDVDGVVNDSQKPEVANVRFLITRNLRELDSILGATRAKVVLTSSWRHWIHQGHMTPHGFSLLLASHAVSAEVIGVTIPDEQCADCGFLDPTPYNWRSGPHVCPKCSTPSTRGGQITKWIEQHGTPDRYICLDDRDDGITAAGHPLVRTCPRLGLEREHTTEAIRLLST